MDDMTQWKVAELKEKLKGLENDFEMLDRQLQEVDVLKEAVMHSKALVQDKIFEVKKILREYGCDV